VTAAVGATDSVIVTANSRFAHLAGECGPSANVAAFAALKFNYSKLFCYRGETSCNILAHIIFVVALRIISAPQNSLLTSVLYVPDMKLSFLCVIVSLVRRAAIRGRSG
jgi:hypothetical protein